MRPRSRTACILALLGIVASCDEPRVVELRYPDDSLYKEFVLEGRALHGPYRVHFQGGVVESEGRYERGVRNGPWVWHHENGALLMQGAFVDGLREGPWEVRRDNGSLVERGTWVRGARHGRFEVGGADGGVTADAYWNDGGLQRLVPR